MSDYQIWIASGDNKTDVARLESYLKDQSVDDIISMDQLLRSDVKWKKCDAQPFNTPPEKHWPNMVSTLKALKEHVIPAIGPVEAQSVYRDPKINKCINGASKSFHLRFYAVDMRPAENVSRETLISKLCELHADEGRALKMGLGIYGGTRFHIDTAGFRKWGRDYKSKSSPCLSLVAPQQKAR